MLLNKKILINFELEKDCFAIVTLWQVFIFPASDARTPRGFSSALKCLMSYGSFLLLNSAVTLSDLLKFLLTEGNDK